MGSVAAVKLSSIISIQDTDTTTVPTHIQSLLQEFHTLFQPATEAPSINNTGTQHHIITTGPPVRSSPRRLTGKKLAAARSFFDLYLQRGIVRPSSSNYASPLNMVNQGEDKWKTTGDYRQLNANTVPDSYPIPRIEDLLMSLTGNKIFTKLDLERAYYQIPVAPEDIQKTAVTTSFGLFEFVGMPLGLRNSTQTFQRFMNEKFRDCPFARIYIDDIIIASRNAEDHTAHIRKVLTILSENKLTLNKQKCKFAQESINFLGFKISAEGF